MRCSRSLIVIISIRTVQTSEDPTAARFSRAARSLFVLVDSLYISMQVAAMFVYDRALNISCESMVFRRVYWAMKLRAFGEQRNLIMLFAAMDEM